MKENFWKKFIYNKNVYKRTVYIYLPVFLVLFGVLNIAAYLSENADHTFLDTSQSFKDRIPIVYNEKYNISFWGLEALHPFDTKKYRHIFEELQTKTGQTGKFIHASKPDYDLLHLAESPEYLASLNSSWTLARITELGFLRFFPSKLSRNLVLEPMLYQMGGSLLAAEAALEHGWAINLGGGFHHASANSGGGFCALADISLIIKFLRKENKIKKAMIVDLDAHQGNGYEHDFINDEDAYIVDFYNYEVFPNDLEAKKAIDLKVEMPAFSGDTYFLSRLESQLPEALQNFKPDIIIYVAGTDILDGDSLGALSISAEGIIRRDEFVFQQALEKKVPIVMLLAGGYQKSNALIIAESILNLRKKFNLF